MSNSAPAQPRCASTTDWPAYYRAVGARPPRELLRRALSFLPETPAKPRLAIDLGCGAGIESAELLRRGWIVLAIDREPEGISRLTKSSHGDAARRLETRVTPLVKARLPRADLVWAGLSLPFAPAHDFDAVWQRIVRSLKRGGIFAGDLFGPRHDWRKTFGTDMTFVSTARLKAMCADLEILSLSTEHGLAPTAGGHVRNHAFQLIARKP